MKFKRTLGIFMMGVMFSSSVPFNVFAEDTIANSNTLSEDVTASGSSISVTSSDISIDFNVIGQWDGGFNGEITVTNTSDSKIENWQIEMTFPQKITNIWNARIDSADNGVYNIKNAGGNNNVDIPVGGSVTFGFTGTYTDDIVAPTNVKLITGKQNASDEEYSIDYQLMSDWGSGFTAQIVITNNTDQPMEAWHLEFDYAGEISSMWNGVIEKVEDGRYYISNADYNSVISANGSVTIGFNGIPDIMHSKPEDFILTYSGNDKSIGLNNEQTNDENEIKIILNTLQFDKIEEHETLAFLWDKPKELTGELDGYKNVHEFYYEITKRDGTLLLHEDMEVAKTWTISNFEEYKKNCVINIVAISDNEEQNIYTINFVNDEDFEDNDNDGLVNYLEEIFGTDIDNADTDGDGLNDFYELLITGTSPLIIDTDSNGISDSDEDFDKDGLTNVEEIEIGTFPNVADSDFDNLSDYDEIYKYGTDPLSLDTDTDGLNDDDEIVLEFNPNDPDTDKDGIKDGEEIVLQTYSAEVNCPESPAVKQVKIELATSGNLAKNVTISPTYNKNMYSTNLVGLIGSPVDITVNSPFEKATVTFIYDPNLVNDTDGLGILWYDKQNGFYEDMNAVLDTNNHTVTFETTHFSEYSLANVKEWFNALQEEIDYNQIPRPKNNSWNGEVVTAQKLVEDYEKEFGLEMGLYNILPYCEDGDVFCEMGKFYMTLNGEEIEYDCLFMSHNEFTEAYYFDAGEEACICPAYGSVAYNTEYDTSTFNLSEEILNKPTVKLPPYAEVTSHHYEFIKRYFIPSGQVDDTDSDGDGLFDVYEIVGMRASNGQIITTNSSEKDTDFDGFYDKVEMGEYNKSKGCYPCYSDPNYANNSLTSNNAEKDYITYEDTDSHLYISLEDAYYKKLNENAQEIAIDFLVDDLQQLTNYKVMYNPQTQYISLDKNNILYNTEGSFIPKPFGNSLLDNIINNDTDHYFTISISETFKYQPDSATIRYCPQENGAVWTKDSINSTGAYTGIYLDCYNPTYIALAHELVHAYRFSEGMGRWDIGTTLPNNYYKGNEPASQDVVIEEYFTVGLGSLEYSSCVICENTIRREEKLPARCAY